MVIMTSRARRGPLSRLVAVVIGLGLAGVPTGVGAWGLDVHRMITRRALDGLPAPLKAFYAPDREFVAEHSVDPDMWRIVGLKGIRGDEDPNHFLDIDGLDEAPPFAGVPRDWDAYVARYGLERANRMGRVPWRVEEIYQVIVARFRDLARPGAAYAGENIKYLTAVIAHYLEDANQPFHAALNYDGQLTNQRGVHARFETQLVLRNVSRLKLAPVTIRPVGPIRDYVFATLVESQSLVDGLLAADRAAARGREFYDDAYFRQLLEGVRPVLERRLSDAASAVASVIVAAWTEAGRPPIAPPPPGTPARIRR
jgi:hypothetical protein